MSFSGDFRQCEFNINMHEEAEDNYCRNITKASTIRQPSSAKCFFLWTMASQATKLMVTTIDKGKHSTTLFEIQRDSEKYTLQASRIKPFNSVQELVLDFCQQGYHGITRKAVEQQRLQEQKQQEQKQQEQKQAPLLSPMVEVKFPDSQGRGLTPTQHGFTSVGVGDRAAGRVRVTRGNAASGATPAKPSTCPTCVIL